jgi:UDP-N-acetylglucosamine 2-epimerase
MDQAAAQMTQTLEACARIDLPRLVFWPGEDAGADGASKAIRLWVGSHPEQAWHTVRNLPPQRFLRLLTQSACLVGNSSVGIRECSYLGVPVVNIGSRQCGRERGPNVWDTVHGVEEIHAAILGAISDGPCPRSTLYGNGHAGERIAEVLCRAF